VWVNRTATATVTAAANESRRAYLAHISMLGNVTILRSAISLFLPRIHRFLLVLEEIASLGIVTFSGGLKTL
jgi:hypothetical protein